MVKKTSKILNDPTGYFFHHWRKFKNKVLQVICSATGKVKYKIQGIKVESGLKLFGIPVITRYPLSEICIGQNCTIRSNSYSNLFGINHKTIISTLKSDALIKIGKNCGLSGNVIGAAKSIIIGNNVILGANTVITDYDWHNIDPSKRRKECESFNPVVIEENVWIGANSIVLKGVTIGKNSVIGAHSVIVKDVPANVIAAGNPCKIIRNIE